MIRAILHLLNDQPLQVDLLEEPRPSDVSILCTNLRTLNGKRPVFADDVGSVFFFPYEHIRFVEIHPSRDQAMLEAPAAAAKPEEAEEDLEIDEDFLRRIREV